MAENNQEGELLLGATGKSSYDSTINGGDNNSGPSTVFEMEDLGEPQNSEIPISVEKWLPAGLQRYVKKFKENGFEDTTFINMLTEKDLGEFGMVNNSARRYLLRMIQSLPESTIPVDITRNTTTCNWLRAIGLSKYESNFNSLDRNTVGDLVDLKPLSETDIEEKFGIQSKGHIRKFLEALEQVPIEDSEAPMSVDDWLPKGLQRYVKIFKDNGFENTTFISMLTESDLEKFGMENNSDRRNLLRMIQSLPKSTIPVHITRNTTTCNWLRAIGLSKYESNFNSRRKNTVGDLVVLKPLSETDIKMTFDIQSKGHIRKFLKALEEVPTEDLEVPISVEDWLPAGLQVR